MDDEVKKVITILRDGLQADLDACNLELIELQKKHDIYSEEFKMAKSSPNVPPEYLDTINERYSLNVVEMEKRYFLSEYLAFKIEQLNLAL